MKTLQKLRFTTEVPTNEDFQNLLNKVSILENAVMKSYQGNLFLFINDFLDYEDDFMQQSYKIQDQKKDLIKEIQILSKKIKLLAPGAFQKCQNLEKANLTNQPNLSYSIFYECPKLSNVILDPETTKIPNSCFQKCQNLSNITFPENLSSIGHSSFRDTSISEINFPSSLSSIEPYAFAHNKLKKLEISNDYLSINPYSFLGNRELEEVKFLSTKTIIPSFGIFQTTPKLSSIQAISCQNLSSIQNKFLIQIPENILIHSLDEIETIIPEGVNKLISVLNFGQSSRQKVYFPKSISSGISDAFYQNQALTSYEVHPENPYFKHSEDKTCVLSKDGTILIKANNNFLSTENSVRTINAYSFSHLAYKKTFQKVTFPEFVERIKNYSFAGGVGTQEINLFNPNIILDSNCFADTSSNLKIVFHNLDLSEIPGENDSEKAFNFISSKENYSTWKQSGELKILWNSISGSSGEFNYLS